jgi:hypothetical protein
MAKPRTKCGAVGPSSHRCTRTPHGEGSAHIARGRDGGVLARWTTPVVSVCRYSITVGDKTWAGNTVEGFQRDLAASDHALAAPGHERKP